jgi:hypothetical protein
LVFNIFTISLQVINFSIKPLNDGSEFTLHFIMRNLHIGDEKALVISFNITSALKFSHLLIN